MLVTIFNDTSHTFEIREGPNFWDEHRGRLWIGTIHPANQNGSAFKYEFFPGEMVDWNLFLHLKKPTGAQGSSIPPPGSDSDSKDAALVIPSHDNFDASEITVYETPGNEIRHWISKPRCSSNSQSCGESGKEYPYQACTLKLQDLASFEAMKDDTRTSMNMIEACCVNLEEILGKVKICHAQCEYLVHFYSNAIRSMIGTYFRVSKDRSHMWSLYDSKKLRLLSSSLNRLMCCVKAAEDLLQACGDESELKRIAMVASMPLSKVNTYSKFDVLIRELSWALDVIQYASTSQDLIFEWSEVAHRYVLKQNHPGTDVSVNARLVRDRTNLLSHISSTSAVDSKLNLPDDFAAVVKKRLQEIPGSHSAGSVPTCFHVDPLHLETGRCISEGGYKKVYVGKWFGLKVAIAIIENTARDIVEKEAGFMMAAQHPNVVDFYGCAFEEMKKEDSGKNEDRSPVGTCYFVMELMQQDLRALIDREAKKHSGGPFSLSVSVDILLQIVEAMIHLQEHNVIYRDLKAKNCLVSVRPKSNLAQDPDVYTIKLIDFGTSKILDSKDAQTATLKVGSTRWMAPEVVGIWKPQSKRRGTSSWLRALSSRKSLTRAPVVTVEKYSGSYSRSADVYSFAMTCYEITTGLLPFHGVANRDIPTELYNERRPLFSHPAAITCPQRLQKLMTDCWAQEPTDRPQFEAIRRELWNIKYDNEVPR